MKQLCNSPKAENRIIEGRMYEIKERALQRAVQINIEIKKNREWTMPKLVENVLSRKERALEEKQKEIDQRRIAKALRHQLAHQNMLSGIGSWLIKRLPTLTKNVKKYKTITTQDINDNLSDTTEEELRRKEQRIAPMFNLPKYARDRNASFQKWDLDEVWLLDQSINHEIKKINKFR